MTTSRITSRLILAITLLISIGIIGFALYSSPPNSDAAWAIIAASLAVIASVIAAWTGQKALEIQEEAQKPYPYPTVEASSRYGFLQLRVKNTGGSAAHNIRLVWDKPLVNSKGEPIRFTDQEGAPDIPVLLPNESATVLIDGAQQFFKSVSDANHTGWIHFQDAAGNPRKHKFYLSVEYYRKRLYYDQEEPMTHYQLQKIPEKLDNVVSELKAIKENISGGDDF
jgi:hypothetical protein